MKEMDLVPVTKLDAANRQLAMAVRMFLNDLDPIAVHTLACASREIYEKHLVIQGRERMFDMFVGGGFLAEHPETAVWNVINAARNFFKHPGKALSEEIEFSDEMNDLALLMACNDGSEINGFAIPEAEAFMTWIAATHESFGPDAEPSTIPGRDDYYRSLDVGVRSHASGSGQQAFQLPLSNFHKFTASFDNKLAVDDQSY